MFPRIILIAFLAYISVYILPVSTYADILGGGTLKDVSIDPMTSTGDIPTQIQGLGWKALKVAKLIITGVALIYMVMIGVGMIVSMGGEEEIKKQKRQITYVLVGFLFLNIPGAIYQIFGTGGKTELSSGVKWSDATLALFFGDSGDIFGGILGFFKAFIFGAAVLSFTWAAFQLIYSGGEEEKQKQAKNKFVYGILGLIFVGFIHIWGGIAASGDFGAVSTGITSPLINISLFFAGPIAIFFLIWGSYYMITSGGDDERMKKGKNIFFNTFIASLILISAFTFLNDLVTLSL